MRNSPNALDIYAKVEDLLGLEEASNRLYSYYLKFLREIEFNSLLDVGCGGGEFLLKLSKSYPKATLKGIDLSPKMVEVAKSKGLNASAKDICNLQEKFDVITCIFDMLNYLSKEELSSFLKCINLSLNSGGYLLIDINTLKGFEEVAIGLFKAEDESRFLTIDSDFQNGVYEATFTLFSKSGSKCWIKEEDIIYQYYHLVSYIAKELNLELIKKEPINLYIKGDKLFLVFKKS